MIDKIMAQPVIGGARILSFFDIHSTNMWLIHSFFIFI